MSKIEITEIVIETEEIVIVSNRRKAGKLLCEKCRREVFGRIAETDVSAAKTVRSENRGETK